MKCPHCYCNYDDSERECPMCGTRSGLSACKDAAHKSITWPGAGQDGGGASARRGKPERERAKPHPPGKRPAAPRRPQAGTFAHGAGEASRKSRRKKLGWAVAVLLVVQFLPALLGLASEVFSAVGRDLEFRDDGFHFSDSWTSDNAGTQEWVAPEPEEDGVLPGGDYYCAETGLVFQVDNSGLTYQLTLGDFEEYGEFFLEYNDPESEAEYYTDEFPASAFDSYLLALWHAEDWDEDAVSCTLAVAYFAQDGAPGTFYLDNPYADAPWLPLDRALLMERAGG